MTLIEIQEHKAAINRLIGIRLAAFMASRGIARDRVASALGTTSNRITRFENGNSEMSAAELVLAAQTLGVTSAVLAGEQEYGEAK